MASLEKIGKGYRVVWRIGGRDSKREKSPVYRTKREAMVAKHAIEADLAGRKAIRSGEQVSWERLAAQFIASKERRSPRYEADCMAICRRLGEKHGWKLAGDVRPAQLRELPAYSRRVVLAVLRYGMANGQAVDPLADRVSVPSKPRKPRVDALSDSQVAELLAMAAKWHPSNAALAHMIATYGHRAETLVGALVSDLDLSRPSIKLTVKNGDAIAHPLTAATVAILAPLVADRPGAAPLFLRHGGDPWPSGYAFALWWSHSIAHGFSRPAGILDLRRYGISRMLALGLDAKTVATITGHRTVSLLLNTYARSDDARRAAAIAALEGAEAKR